MPDEQIQEAYDAMLAAADAHITHQSPFIPGFVPFVIDTDVHLPLWGKTAHRGTYQIQLPEDGTPVDAIPPENSWIWMMEADPESLREAIEKAEKSDAGNGRPGRRTDWDAIEATPDDSEPVKLKFRLVRLDVAEGRPLTIEEVWAWLAIQDADERGDHEWADRIFSAAYSGYEGARPRAVTSGQYVGTNGTVSAAPAKPARRRKRKGENLTANRVMNAIDPLTNALMGRNSHHVGPGAYFTESPVKVPTGAGGYVLLDVRADSEMDIDAAYRDYQLNDRDRFWLDALYTLAMEHGRTSIRGSEILKLRGYANPYDETSESTMLDCAHSIGKAVSTRIAIDVTHEKRRRRGKRAELTKSVRLQQVVAASVDLDEYALKDGEGRRTGLARDFTVNLSGDDPERVLPLAAYAKARGMLTTVTADDYKFTGIRQLNTDDRQMWAYVLRIVRAHGLSPTILFETMWRNLELREPNVSEYLHPTPIGEDGLPTDPTPAPPELVATRKRRAEYKQRQRLVEKLEKMLDQKAGISFKSWAWHRDASGKVDGVRITRNPSGK